MSGGQASCMFDTPVVKKQKNRKRAVCVAGTQDLHCTAGFSLDILLCVF